MRRVHPQREDQRRRNQPAGMAARPLTKTSAVTHQAKAKVVVLPSTFSTVQPTRLARVATRHSRLNVVGKVFHFIGRSLLGAGPGGAARQGKLPLTPGSGRSPTRQARVLGGFF